MQNNPQGIPELLAKRAELTQYPYRNESRGEVQHVLEEVRWIDAQLARRGYVQEIY